MKKCYVYAHINPLTNIPFYIGKGTGNRIANGNRNIRWKKYVSDLNNQGLHYETKILHICNDTKDALVKEALEIDLAIEKGYILVNVNIPDINRIVNNISDSKLLIAEFIKGNRKAKKLTQQQLADNLNVGLHFIRDLEQGLSAYPVDKVNKVLNYFNSYLIPK